MCCLPDISCPAVAELHFSMLNVASAVWFLAEDSFYLRLSLPSPDNTLPRNTLTLSGLFSTQLPDGHISRTSSSGTELNIYSSAVIQYNIWGSITLLDYLYLKNANHQSWRYEIFPPALFFIQSTFSIWLLLLLTYAKRFQFFLHQWGAASITLITCCQRWATFPCLDCPSTFQFQIHSQRIQITEWDR